MIQPKPASLRSHIRPYRRRQEPDLEAVQVTESALHAEAIREWLGPWGWEPNTSAMRHGCVVVRVSLRRTELAPPGSYIVRTKDGALQVWDRQRFEAIYEPAD